MENYQRQIDLLRKHGFRPLAVTESDLEDLFIFSSQEEADIAFYRFEQNNENHPDTEFLDGWWYGVADFAKEYQNRYDELEIVWLDDDVQAEIEKRISEWRKN